MYLLIFFCCEFLINFRAVIVPELAGTMPYAVIMLSRELIVAITEQVFFEIYQDAS